MKLEMAYVSFGKIRKSPSIHGLKTRNCLHGQDPKGVKI
jgi:hypothetical protein